MKHITKDCPRVPKDVRDKWILEAAAGQDQCTDGEDAVQLGKRRRDSIGSSSSSSSRQLDMRRFGRGEHSLPKEALTKEEKKQADFSFLRYMVCSKVLPLLWLQQLLRPQHRSAAAAASRPQQQKKERKVRTSQQSSCRPHCSSSMRMTRDSRQMTQCQQSAGSRGGQQCYGRWA
jgi:hypothetical protein